MRVAFTTCVKLGLSCIEEIYNVGGKLDLLITLKDEKARKKSGRIYLDKFSNEHKIPLIKINNINDKEVVDRLRKMKIDWLFIIGWSQIAENELLNTPKKGCIGMHPTLLPIGRGRASIPWSILKGLNQTGVTMFKLDEGIDTGEIIGQGIIPLNATITATELYAKVNDMHIQLISRYWNSIINDDVKLVKQDDSKATYWEARRPEDGEITKNMTVNEALTLIRAVNKPYPGAFVVNKNVKYTIWQAKANFKTGDFELTDGYIEYLKYDTEVYYEKK